MTRAGRQRRRAAPGAAPIENPTFDTVVGHRPQLTLLRRQLELRSLAHAYWIVGPPQIGKTTVALALASELLSAERWPGGLGSHPDLWLDQGTEPLLVDRIRGAEPDSEQGPTLQHFLSLSSYAGSGKVAVIGDADRLTLSAANTLLRMLEEPPLDSVICLCTSRPESEHLPDTLRSRCQTLRLSPVDPEAIASWLVERRGVPADAAPLAAALSQGRPGLALELAADRELGPRTRQQLDLLLSCVGATPAALLRLSQMLAERGSDRQLAVFALRSWAAFLRDCCALAAGAEELSRIPERQSEAGEWSERLGLAECLRRYDLALDALARLSEAATPRLVLDRFLLLTFAQEPRATEGPRVGAAAVSEVKR